MLRCRAPSGCRRPTLASRNEVVAQHRKVEPLYHAKPRKACPVCGHPSYSSAGIHPQCVAQRSSTGRLRRAQRVLSAMERVPTPSARSWHRKCPGCGKDVHMRQRTCPCGHTLVEPAKGA